MASPNPAVSPVGSGPRQVSRSVEVVGATTLVPAVVIEWRHPFGHRWRWEFEQVGARRTRVIETFDDRDTGAVKDRLGYYERMGYAKANSKGIEATLTKLAARFPLG